MGSDNGFSPNRREAIIWTNDGIVHWRIYASLGLNELTHLPSGRIVDDAFICNFVDENWLILVII